MATKKPVVPVNQPLEQVNFTLFVTPQMRENMLRATIRKRVPLVPKKVYRSPLTIGRK